MKQLKNGIVIILLLIIVSVSLLWSSTTGKIAGRITDKTTGEVLIGANVIVVGSSLGAATDLNGEYTILYIPPGTYSVQISHVGYTKATVKDIRIFIDQTSRIDVALEQDIIKLGETIILAERRLIKPDVATSATSISSEEIATIPTTSVMSAVGLQAGVRGGWSSGIGSGDNRPTFLLQNVGTGKVSVQDGMSIRGGSGDNMLFLMDGVTIRDPRNNEPSTKIPMSAVNEVSVERGGFNAEYGQVQSGVVNVITKEGGKNNYSGSFQIRLSPPSPKYARVAGTIDVNDPYSFALRPFFDPDVCWTGTENGVWDQYKKSKYANFTGWNAISKALCTDNDPSNDLTPLGAQRAFEYEIRKKQINDQPDYDIDGGFGGPVPVISEALGNLRFFVSYRGTRDMLAFPLSRPDYRDHDMTFQVNSDITSTTKLTFTGLIGSRYTIRSNWDAGTGSYYYPRYPNEVADVAGSISDPTSLYGLFSDYNFCLADIGHQSLAARLTHTVSSATYYEVLVEHFKTDYFVRPQALRDTSQKTEILPGFFEDSNPFGYWTDQVRGALLTNGGQTNNSAFPRDNSDFSSTTFKANFTSQVNFQNLLKGGIEFVYNDLNFDYGKILAGGQASEKYSYRVKMRLFPYRAAAYLQDKLEFNEFTVNAGLRLDYSNSNVQWWNMGVFDPTFFSSAYDTMAVYPTANSKPKLYLSPRLGISHPISEYAKLFFNYGHFLQLPQYESMFRLQRDDSRKMTSYGEPNLVLAKTVSYELGVDFSLADEFLLNVAGFYNDISDMQDFTTYTSASNGISYTKSTSNGYQDTRGFELTLRKSSGTWLTGFINYTYQVITSGHFRSAQLFDDVTSQKQYDAATVNLYQDRPHPQPFARANIALNSPKDFGPELFGHCVLGGFSLNLVFDWQAGAWTTWSPNDPYVAYNIQTKDFFNTYLRLDKNVDIGKIRVQVFMDITNVLNTLRLSNTGDRNYLQSLHLPKSNSYNNIVGDDKVGDYRTPGVDWQPVEHVMGALDRSSQSAYQTGAWYFEDATQKYYEWKGQNNWVEVDRARVDKFLSDKAYINMPNASTFWFLNPRNIYFGLKVSFDFGE
jgi:outer membrane receptor protein involved in Fe transport